MSKTRIFEFLTNIKNLIVYMYYYQLISEYIQIKCILIANFSQYIDHISHLQFFLIKKIINNNIVNPGILMGDIKPPCI